MLAQLDGAPDDVPASVLRLDEDETALRAQVRRMTREGDEVVLEVFAGLRRVDQGGDFPEVAARLLGPGEPLELAAAVGPDAAVTRWMGEPHQYHDYGVVTVRIPLSALSTGPWQLELEMQHGGVRRTGLVAELEGHGSAARTLPVGGRVLRWVGTAEGLQLVVADEHPPARAGRRRTPLRDRAGPPSPRARCTGRRNRGPDRSRATPSPGRWRETSGSST